MKKVYTLFLIFTLSFTGYTSAQNAQGCDGVRYFYNVYNEISRTTVQYGSNTTATGSTVDLEMDVFQPIGDTQVKRPLMIWAHGGAFVGGERSEMDSLCILFAKKGFVTATITYRLYPLQLGIPDSLGMLDAAMKSLGDLKAAIRYFRQDAATENEFQIDPDFIYLGGVSAGAIMAVHAAYMDEADSFPEYLLNILDANGGLEGSTGSEENHSYSSEVHGVFNLSGAIHKLDWIQADEPPIASYHGTLDEVVPYNNGAGAILGFEFMSLNGSGSIHTRAEELGITNYLVMVPGAGHETAYDNQYQTYLEEFIENGQIFLYDLVCQGIAIDVEEVRPTAKIGASPNPSKDLIILDLSMLKGTYNIAIFDVLGNLVLDDKGQNAAQYMLRKNTIGSGVFFVQVRQQSEDVPTLMKIVFE